MSLPGPSPHSSNANTVRLYFPPFLSPVKLAIATLNCLVSPPSRLPWSIQFTLYPRMSQCSWLDDTASHVMKMLVEVLLTAVTFWGGTASTKNEIYIAFAPNSNNTYYKERPKDFSARCSLTNASKNREFKEETWADIYRRLSLSVPSLLVTLPKQCFGWI